ncbi:unnamed protein product, partial [Litomosoides sigmodontis]
PLPRGDYTRGTFLPPLPSNFMRKPLLPIPEGECVNRPPLQPPQVNHVYRPPAQDNCVQESPQQTNCRHAAPPSSRIKRCLGNRKCETRGTSLASISEGADSNADKNEHAVGHGGERCRNGTAFSATTSQQPLTTTSLEGTCSNDNNKFLHAAEGPASNQHSAEDSACTKSSEVASVRSGEKLDMMYSSLYGESIPSHTSVAIVFIYGEKMFIGSIGDSRIVLLRQKCHYLDAVYLNDPPLTWYPVTSAKNSRSNRGQYILFEKPIVRGGFLIDDSSIFLLMFNDGVTTNMLNLDNYYHTSHEVNRRSVEMVIKILKNYPAEDVAHKFVTYIQQSFNQKYESDTIIDGITCESMSFLFADLKGLIPNHITCNQLLQTYPSRPDITEPNAQSYSRTTESNNSSSIGNVQVVSQEAYNCEENRCQAEMKNASIANDDNTWVFIRTDSNGMGYFN